MEPVQLLETGQNGNDLILKEEALKILENDDRKVTVVAVAGPYRTGKSYLLNCLMNRRRGFPLGSTIAAETKGIWMWIGDFFGDPDHALVLLDTEGLDDPDKGDASHDMALFSFALLLSSMFVYNTKGTIDARSLDGLYCATEMADFFSASDTQQQNSGRSTLSKIMPNFIWAVRDQHLELEINGETVTPKEYLEHFLQSKRGTGRKIMEYNELRETLKQFFPERDCFLFPPPTGDIEQLNNLDSLEESELDPEFVERGREFTQHIKTNSKAKEVLGCPLTGKSLAAFCRQYLESIKKKNIRIESSLQSVSRSINEKAMQNAVQMAQQSMDHLVEDLPMSGEYLLTMSTSIFETAENIYHSQCLNLNSEDPHSAQLCNELVKINDEAMKNNEIASKFKCETVLRSLFEPLEEKSRRGDFLKVGGFAHFQNKVADVIGAYSKHPEDHMGPCKDKVLDEFIANSVSTIAGRSE